MAPLPQNKTLRSDQDDKRPRNSRRVGDEKAGPSRLIQYARNISQIFLKGAIISEGNFLSFSGYGLSPPLPGVSCPK